MTKHAAKACLGLGQAADKLPQGSALRHIAWVQLGVCELAQPSTLQVWLLQPEGRAVAGHHAQAGPDAVHLPPYMCCQLSAVPGSSVSICLHSGHHCTATHGGWTVLIDAS